MPLQIRPLILSVSTSLTLSYVYHQPLFAQSERHLSQGLSTVDASTTGTNVSSAHKIDESEASLSVKPLDVYSTPVHAEQPVDQMTKVQSILKRPQRRFHSGVLRPL